MKIQLNHDKFWGAGDSKQDYKTTLLANKMVYASANPKMPKPRDLNGFKILPQYSDDELLFFVDHPQKELLIVSRGSVTQTDWKITDTALVLGLITWSKRYNDNLKKIKEVYSKFKGYSILFTGHSLGGNLAHNFYEEFKKKGIKTEVIMFNRGTSPLDPLIKPNEQRDPNKIQYTFKDDKLAEAFLKDKSTKHVVKESPHKTNKHSIWLHR